MSKRLTADLNGGPFSKELQYNQATPSTKPDDSGLKITPDETAQYPDNKSLDSISGEESAVLTGFNSPHGIIDVILPFLLPEAIVDESAESDEQDGRKLPDLDLLGGPRTVLAARAAPSGQNRKQRHAKS